MAKKKELDKLSLDMIECEKAGFGCHYGAWKAMQPKVKPVPVELPEDWKACEHCGKPFKPKVSRQKYCEANCGYEAGKIKYKKRRSEYLRGYRATQKAE